MKIITAEEFTDSLHKGFCRFEETTVIGDVALGMLVLNELTLIDVTFEGGVSGQITIAEFYIRSPRCWYYSNIRPLCYCGSLIKDLTT